MVDRPRTAPNTAPADADAAVDEVPRFGRFALYSVQHLLTFYATVLVLPVIIAAGIHLPQAETVVFLAATVLAGGIATIVQTVGVWRIGIRKPLVLGGSAVVIGPATPTAAASADCWPSSAPPSSPGSCSPPPRRCTGRCSGCFRRWSPGR
ncbi:MULTISPECIES: solute carrier family 23 protein [Amycolatopsis]|uniref:solute carrier family 23 protein n=1 Tax=Amycolatopsis TaxID=1813 RepID=UPI00106EDA61|nr:MULTISPECIES: solute carrier family 23 protein [Amycolatopsis]